MSRDITLSKKYGMNPALTLCPRCKKNTTGVILPGAASLFECSQGHKIVGRREGKCTLCGDPSENWRLLERGIEASKHPIVGTELCDGCKAELAEYEEIVRSGGVYWRCKDCGSSGVIKPNSTFCQMVRNQAGIQAPDPIGVEFSKEHDCPVCGPDPK